MPLGLLRLSTLYLRIFLCSPPLHGVLAWVSRSHPTSSHLSHPRVPAHLPQDHLPCHFLNSHASRMSEDQADFLTSKRAKPTLRLKSLKHRPV
ncbi:hypothetical protein QBC46DRAFT_135242 [Diplogelasinospora grovesii]|uniref:Secreted protein n=1 Tax=Diplogelasinospora grovesii TaxID=303347 RepID=A0AAN6S4Z5_9PEZI|nr:hypothetical protein QBC46DRAFT_135242 [Diplogelasinospora grovesii]